MFVGDALTGDRTVEKFFIRSKFMIFTASDRMLGVSVKFLDAHVARIGFDLDFG